MDNSQRAVEIFNKYSKEYQEKFMDVSLYHHSLDLFCENISKQNATILELACGPGNITKYLLTKRPDFKIKGSDLSPNMIELARNNNPAAQFEIMDCRDLAETNKKYDGIMAGFCLPYLSREEAVKFIRDASLILNEGGIIYISTMEDDNSKSGIRNGSQGDEMFMNFHEAEYLKQALQENNLNIIEMQRLVTTTTDGGQVVDLVLIARKTV